MLQKFDPNEVVRITTDSIYVQKEAFYKIKRSSVSSILENIPVFFKQKKVKDQDLCPHSYTTCAWCEEDLLIPGYIKWIKEFQKTETPLQKEKIQEIKPDQWRDKGEKIYDLVTDIVYWPKNRHWELIKKIPDSISPPIHDPITRYRNLYLNGGGAQTWHSFFRWNGVGNWTPERMGEKKIPPVICCGDDAQPPPFFGEMPHEWLKKHADYYEEVLTDYQAKYPILHKLKKIMRHTPIPLIYRPRDGRKQNCLVPIPGLSEKQELVKNNIVYLSLNILFETFIADILKEEKILDWDLGYAMTVHTSQGMTLEASQQVWVIDENLAWDNLIYFAVGRVEYLNQLIQIEDPPLPLEIVEARNKKVIEQSLRTFISEKLEGYMNQDKEKDRKFNLSINYVLKLKDSQEDKSGDPDQWIVDRINNDLGHIEGNVRLTCLECNRHHQV
ncbi:hypothetical protein Glove_212g85 [Diversispora epigaea]|uniref:UvrD-like helicase C-terminal domain-containing protein n=1 Tax=Diversispora epigaea TaxID=1348612 RepID=A0A397IIL6_9GLOM|nr:hypothetical protein Glove_212g85 [Diversispora epigaea]